MTRRHPRRTLLLVGLGLLGCCIVLRMGSAGLTSTDVAGAGRTLALVAGLSAMGGLFLWMTRLIAGLPPARDAPAVLVACVAIGLLMRLSQWDAAPVYEKDYLRYLWDGAVLSSGVDPYANTPASIGTQRLLCSLRRGPAPAAGDPDACTLSDLADDAQGLADRIGYADVTTIYPPVAQLAFAAAYRIQPFSLAAWRGLLLGAELMSVTVLILVLLGVHEDPLWALVYWWNPLVIVHIANGAHVEALLTPFLVVALSAVSRQRVWTAAVALAMATAIKLWPLLLLPSLLSASADDRLNRRAMMLGVALSGLLLAPELLALRPDSGLTVFASEWRRNAFAFPWLVTAWSALQPGAGHAERAARITVGVVVLLLGLRNAVAGPADIRTWAQRWGLCIAALFLLAPTSYPWYFISVFPFLCFWRADALLLLTITLPLYFALYIVEPRGEGAILSKGVVAMEFLPVWVGLAWMTQHRRARSPVSCGPAPSSESS